MSDPNSLSAEPATPEMIRDGIARLLAPPPLTHLAVGAVQMAQMLAALDEPNEAVLAGRRPGKTRSNHDALYQPPWVEVPPPTVRSAEALAKVRAFKQARRAARRRLGKSKDRAGRPL